MSVDKESRAWPWATRWGSPELSAIKRDQWVDQNGEPYWTRERILAAIKRWAARRGEPPRAAEWSRPRKSRQQGITRPRKDRPDASTVCAVFGTWNAAIRAAGFDPRPPGGQRGPWSRCKKGHPLEGANVITRRGGLRRCRTCHNAAKRAAYRRGKAVA